MQARSTFLRQTRSTGGTDITHKKSISIQCDICHNCPDLVAETEKPAKCIVCGTNLCNECIRNGCILGKDCIEHHCRRAYYHEEKKRTTMAKMNEIWRRRRINGEFDKYEKEEILTRSSSPVGASKSVMLYLLCLTHLSMACRGSMVNVNEDYYYPNIMPKDDVKLGTIAMMINEWIKDYLSSTIIRAYYWTGPSISMVAILAPNHSSQGLVSQKTRTEQTKFKQEH